MKERPNRDSLIGALLLCCAFLGGVLMTRSSAAEQPGSATAAQIDQSVISSLASHGFKRLRVISHIDLTKPFQTSSQWTLVVVRDDGPPSQQLAGPEEHGPVFVCLVRSATPDCAQKLYRHVGGEDQWSETPFHLLSSRIVYTGPDDLNPLLLVKVCGAEGINGNCGIATAIYSYSVPADRFVRVFLNLTGRNNNEATRFVESGPLQGDVIVNRPTEHAPYAYWIEVFKQERSKNFVRILRYRGRTGYGDGNPLAVADSEMPEILRRLGLWQPGDALPIPARPPSGCNHLVMRRGEEWCKQ